MYRPSSSSPRRDVPARQDDEIELIASQIEWHNDQSGNEHSDEQFGYDKGQGNEWEEPADPHPVLQRERRSEEMMDPDYELEQHQEARTGWSKRRRRSPSPTEEDNESSGPDITTSDSQNKRRRGQRGRNQYPEGQFTVNAISPVGERIDPPQIVAKFRNVIGAIIRTKVVVDPTIEKWTLVPEGKKETMWQLLSRTFIFPRGTRDKVKHYARKMLGETFRR